jgi:hypothetical protein
MKLPSNRKFGYFFSTFFLCAGLYSFYSVNTILGNIFLIISVLFIFTTYFKSELLLPLNKLWMGFGLLLGSIISPIILGIIFFGLFTPYGIIMKIFGRDELRLKIKKEKSYWIKRSYADNQYDFNRQF